MNRFSIFIFGLLALFQLTCGVPEEVVVGSQDPSPPAAASEDTSLPECSESIPCPAGETCTEGACVVAAPPEVCGDGVVNNGGVEQCDDGNTADGDGCDSACQNEICGDGVLNNGEAEQCDDGNTADGDCCDSTCQFEANGSACDDDNACTAVDQCDGAGLCTNGGSTCGNGSLEADCGEQCDDNNTINGDGCGDTCQNEVCGDGSVNNNGTEQCDDGNTTDDDGCDSACQNEICGDGVVNNGGVEQCDDGNNDSGDGCQADCLLPACGDGVLDDGESCDDGNTDSGDGCSAACVPECLGDPTRVTYAGGPGTSACQWFEDDQVSCEEAYHLGGGGVASCYWDEGDGWCYGCGSNNENSGNCNNTCRVAVCGDGYLGLGEQCDDGGTDPGDGCEADCTLSVSCVDDTDCAEGFFCNINGFCQGT